MRNGKGSVRGIDHKRLERLNNLVGNGGQSQQMKGKQSARQPSM